MNHTLYAWVTTTQDDKPSLVGAYVGDKHVPIIHHDLDVVRQFRSAAVHHGTAMGQPVSLVKLAQTEVIEEIAAPASPSPDVQWLTSMTHSHRSHAFHAWRGSQWRSSVCGLGFEANDLGASLDAPQCPRCLEILTGVVNPESRSRPLR